MFLMLSAVAADRLVAGPDARRSHAQDWGTPHGLRRTTRSLARVTRGAGSAARAPGACHRPRARRPGAPADGAGRAGQVDHLHRAAATRGPRAGRHPRPARRRPASTAPRSSAARCGRRRGGGRARRRARELRAGRHRRRARGGSRASTSTSSSSSGGTAAGTLDFSLRPLRDGDGRSRADRRRGPADHRPQARRGADRRPERRALGRHRAPGLADPRLPRAAAGRAQPRPARAAAGRCWRARSASAACRRTPRCAASCRASAWPRSTRSSRSTAMLEQVKRDHSETQLELADDDLAPPVQLVAAQFEPLAAERNVRFSGRDPRGAAGPLRRRARQPGRLQPARQRAALHAGRGHRPLHADRARATAARIEVADSGAGVPPDERDRLFERFRTLTQRQPPPGGRRARARDRARVRRAARRHRRVDGAPEGGALFEVVPPAPARRRRARRPRPRSPSSSRRCAAARSCASRWSPSWARSSPSRSTRCRAC